MSNLALLTARVIVSHIIVLRDLAVLVAIVAGGIAGLVISAV